MLHDDFRNARLAAGLSQAELARRAKVSRRQIQLLETGANVTLDTVRRIAPMLPNLARVTLGGLEMVTANADLEEVRRRAFALFEDVSRLIYALGAVPPTPQQSGTYRHAPGSESEERIAQRLDKIVEKEKQKGRRSDS
jgi:transcriptional regulator with XRE-family HTH domain